MMSRVALVICVLVFSAFNIPSANAATDTEKQKSCAKFVQEFYNWYLAKSKGENKLSPEEIALRDKAANFSPDLVKQLKEDLYASKQNKNEVVGLDFDPFLNAQDMPSKYEVGQVKTVKSNYTVDVHGYWNGKRKKNQTLFPSLRKRMAYGYSPISTTQMATKKIRCCRF